MLAIRREQLEELEVKQLQHGALTYLRATFPEETGRMEDQDLPGLVRKGVLAARQCGITDQFNVIRYVHLMLSLSPGFELKSEMSWALPFLRNTRLNPDEKLDLILERLVFGH